MKQVLIVSREFPPYIGGAATYVYSLAISLSRNGIKPLVVTTRSPSPRDIRSLEADGITIVEAGSHKKLYLFLMASAYLSAGKKEHWDAVILADSSAIKMGALVPGLIDSNTWAVFHGKEIETFFTHQSLPFRIGIGSKRIVNLLNRCRGVIAVSRDLASRIESGIENLQTQLHVIPHCVDTDFFQPLPPNGRTGVRRNLGLQKANPVIFSAGRLVPGKGHETSIAACDALIKELPDLKLLIAGNGPLQNALAREVEQRDIQRNVVFLGPVDRETMRTYFQLADVFLLPSEYESFGLVYIEANSCGCFVIAGNNGGVRDVIHEGVNGLMIPPCSPTAAAAALRTFFGEIAPDGSTETNCRKVALTNYSPKLFAERTISLIMPNA